MSEFHYGGQAVLEGVMMRGQRHMAVAVRNPQGKIVTRVEPLSSWIYTSRWAKLPFLRGLAMLWDTLSLGYRALSFSADVALQEEGDDVHFAGGMMWVSLLLALAFVIVVFILLPTFLVGLMDRYIQSSLLSTLIEGLMRLGLFLGYLATIGLLPDIRRVFAYHGAEHKTINAYEAGAPLEPEAMTSFGTAHLRCGTGFLLVVLVLFVVITALMGRQVLWQRLLWRVILVPVVAGISYEWLKLSANYRHHRLIRALAAPGLAVQRLSTREPSEDMLEVAIAALKKVLETDGEASPG